MLIEYFRGFHSGKKTITDNCSFPLLQIANHFENALFGKAGRFFLPVPVWDFTTQINSHDLLDESSNHIEVFIVNGAHSYKVDIDDAEDVPPYQLSMLLCKLFIPKT